MKILFILLLLISLVRWFTNYINYLSLLRYMQIKNYNLPTKNEMSDCSQCVIKHLIKGF